MTVLTSDCTLPSRLNWYAIKCFRNRTSQNS